MKVLFLCGIIDEENIEEIAKQTASKVDYAANLFQQKLLEGFIHIMKDNKSLQDEGREIEEISVLSAPFIGAYPKGSNISSFKGFGKNREGYTYVKFNNIWGVRNISRTNALKKAIKTFAESEGEKLILIYCPHTPFVKAAEYAKKIDKSIKICLYAPDVPQYMNISDKINPIYKIAKKYDIASITKHMACVDTFVLLTKYMVNYLPVGNKPYKVIEGIVSPNIFETNRYKEFAEIEDGKKYIVYTGSITEKYGVSNLVDAMKYISDTDIFLVLCGLGDAYQYAKSASEKDKRIILLGQVTSSVAAEWQQKATVLVNPRQGTEVYTRVSFPSKNIEYLLSGNPVVAYLLSGMPEIYRSFIFEVPQGNPAVALAETIEKAILADNKEKSERFMEYAKQNLRANYIANEIIRLNFEKQ